MDLIEDYIQNRLSGRTRKTYKTYLKRYLRTTKQTPSQFIKKDIRDIGNELIVFIKGEQQKGTPPKTIYNIKSVVTGFLLYKNKELQPRDRDQIKYMLKGTEGITQKELLTKNQLKEILQHGETKARAIFLIASSSGMRISEILSLTQEHIDFDYNPTKIIISGKYTKTRRSRITFISNEAKETLLAWLKEREQYLQNAVKKYSNKNRIKTIEDNRIFPMSYENTRIIWKRLTSKAGYNQKDPDTGIHIYGIHTLRTYFKTRMLAKQISPKIIDIFAGHRTNRPEYDKLTTEELAEIYLKGMPELEIYTQLPDLTEVTKELENLRYGNERLEMEQKYLWDTMVAIQPFFNMPSRHGKKKDEKLRDFGIITMGGHYFIQLENDNLKEIEVKIENKELKIYDSETKDMIGKIKLTNAELKKLKL